METCINYCEPGFAFISSDERKWINRIRKLHAEHPGEVFIIKQPEINEGFIYAKFPQKWARVTPPRKISISDDDRARRAEQLRLIRSSQTNKSAGVDTEE